jgi:hypothetical protein
MKTFGYIRPEDAPRDGLVIFFVELPGDGIREKIVSGRFDQEKACWIDSYGKAIDLIAVKAALAIPEPEASG